MRSWPNVSTGRRTRPSFWTTLQDAVDDIDVSSANAQSGIVYALDYANTYGFDPTGSDDSGPAIVQALADISASGGGTIVLPPGDIRIAPQGDEGGVRWGIPIPPLTSNVTIQGSGRATRIIFDLPDASDYSGLFHIGGGTGWQANDVRQAPVFDLGSDALRGADTLTLDTAADAANFDPGDYIFIRTGQTLDISGENQPDSEINQVLGADAGTGVITLRWPTAKPYALESVDTGTGKTYQSIPGGAGSDLPFGVANVTDRLCHNLGIRDLHIECNTGNMAVFIGGSFVGLDVRNVSADIIGAFTSMGNDRRVRINRVDCQQRNTGTEYFVAPSTGSCDYVVSECEVSSTNTSYFHLHEGVSQFKAFLNTIRNTHVAADRQAVSVRARAYDAQFNSNSFINAGTLAVVYVDDTCPGGGIISNNYVEYRAGVGVAEYSANWITSGNNEVLVS